MNEIIASFLIQNGECQLAGIGKFKTEAISAVSDVASKMIYPPETNYLFHDDCNVTSEELIAYVAARSNTDMATAGRQVQDWLHASLAHLDAREPLSLPTIGSLIKNDEGFILFQGSTAGSSHLPVPAIRVIHEKDTHKVLVGDIESDSEKMNQMLHRGESESTGSWWKPALIIFSVAILLYVFYLLSGGFGQHLRAHDAPATYISR